jgi:peptide-methionine (R)-S-oxide reductase
LRRVGTAAAPAEKHKEVEMGLFGKKGGAPKVGFAVIREESEWRKMLSPEQYDVMFQHATERPFTSALLHEKRKGRFLCAACAQPLFDSNAKFDSGTGWPSYWQPIDGAIATESDNSLFMTRTEVHCSNCGAHQGHVFEDGPQPTGLRFCINGVALKFEPKS